MLDYSIEIPISWEVRKLVEIADIDRECLPTNTPADYQFNYVSLSDVDNETVEFQTSIQVFGSAPSRAKRIVNKGDLLLSTVRPNLEGFLIIRDNLDNLVASTGFSVLTPIHCDGEYLFQFLFSSIFKRQIGELLVGSNYPAINSSDIRNLKILVPPLPEQRAIAACLRTWDEAISKTNELIKQKELRKKWLMQQLLSGKKRLKGFEGEWRETSMNAIFYRVNRRNTGGNINVVTISAQRGFVKQTDFFNKSIASESLSEYFLVNKGEFCYNKSYANGYPWGATKRLNDFDFAVVTTLYICFGILDLKQNSGDFFEHFFNGNLLDKGLTKIAHEGGRAHGLLNVTPSDFFSLELRIPGFIEQEAIAKVINKADKDLRIVKTKLQLLKKQKRGLMEVLLAGRRRLNNGER